MQVGFLTNPTYKVRLKIDILKTVEPPKTTLLDTRAGPSLVKINGNYLKSQWKCELKHLESSKLETATKELISIHGLFLLVVQI